MSPSCHTATSTPCPSPPRRARLPGRTSGRACSPTLLAGSRGAESQGWGEKGRLGTGTSWLPCRAASHRSLAAPRTPVPVPPDPAGYRPALKTAPRPSRELGAAHVPGCVSCRPGRHQAGGGRRSTSSSKSMCRSGVMGPSWRLFLRNRSQRMGNPLSLPPHPGQPPGAPRGPPPACTSPGACSQLWRGEDACRIGPGRVGEGMDVARQPASSVAMATPPSQLGCSSPR